MSIDIHTFGDSHSNFGWAKVAIPGIDIHRHIIGPMLMYSFGKGKIKRMNIAEKDGYKRHDNFKEVQNGDIVCFCFGEIDCRRHLYKHGGTEPINQMVDNYFDAIKENIKQFNNLQVWVYNVVPPLLNDTHNKREGLSKEKHKKYVQYMNQALRKKCKKVNYAFVDIYNESSDKNGFLLQKFAQHKNDVHMNNAKPLKKFIKKQLQLKKNDNK